MRLAWLAVAAAAVLAAPAFAQECGHTIQPVAAGEHFGALSLFRFGSRWELQVETPGQMPTADGRVALDGFGLDGVLVVPGMDDLLVNVTDDPGELGLSPGLADAFASARVLTVTGSAGGLTQTAEYRLGDIVSVMSDLLRRCGRG